MVSPFVVVVPVKPPAAGKSRLRGPSNQDRGRLACAFALDTTAAAQRAAGVAEVLVATDDTAFARQLTARGCSTVPDGATTGLNGALRQAAAEARRRWPHLVPVVLLADLPALRSDDLDAALDLVVASGMQPSFVVDADGTGSTLYAAPHDSFEPLFGTGSAAAHRAAGVRPVPGELASLRRDVDDLHDLHLATALGLGPETARVVAELELSG